MPVGSCLRGSCSAWMVWCGVLARACSICVFWCALGPSGRAHGGTWETLKRLLEVAVAWQGPCCCRTQRSKMHAPYVCPDGEVLPLKPASDIVVLCCLLVCCFAEHCGCQAQNATGSLRCKLCALRSHQRLTCMRTAHNHVARKWQVAGGICQWLLLMLWQSLTPPDPAIDSLEDLFGLRLWQPLSVSVVGVCCQQCCAVSGRSE